LSVFPRLYRPRLYRMLVAAKGYDAEEGFAREQEFYFMASLRGSPRTVRRTLARRGIAYFQTTVYRKFRIWPRRSQIRISFENEEQAEAVDRAIKVYIRSLRYRGKQWMVTKLPPREIPYARKSRRAKTRKRKRAKAR
jgi:hypothetical protein